MYPKNTIIHQYTYLIQWCVTTYFFRINLKHGRINLKLMWTLMDSKSNCLNSWKSHPPESVLNLKVYKKLMTYSKFVLKFFQRSKSYKKYVIVWFKGRFLLFCPSKSGVVLHATDHFLDKYVIYAYICFIIPYPF